ncbi:DUF5329 domain-containing protein [Massilia sp. TWP1-3-3]|uniref:DUF5329 domain-containing protein n=1 Tax=Massilia sp. TWP1-3-3 TaxID=2804573 RepID=UPI003CF61EF7
MKKLLILVGTILAANMAVAATPEITKAEVAHLLGAVEQSQCRFNRNGSWYDAKSAKKHLASKYEYLDKKDMLPTAESFIKLGASTSSSSGKAYMMACEGQQPVTSAVWLIEELNRYRKTAALK